MFYIHHYLCSLREIGHRETYFNEDALDRLDRCLSTDCDPVRVGAPHLFQYWWDCHGITRPIPDPIGHSNEEGLGRETAACSRHSKER